MSCIMENIIEFFIYIFWDLEFLLRWHFVHCDCDFYFHARLFRKALPWGKVGSLPKQNKVFCLMFIWTEFHHYFHYEIVYQFSHKVTGHQWIYKKLFWNQYYGCLRGVNMGKESKTNFCSYTKKCRNVSGLISSLKPFR